VTLLYWSGVATAAAGLLHIAIAIGGPSWYAFFGAPHRLVEGARAGDSRAPLTCVAIACILLVFAAYAFSGSGVGPQLPLLKPVLAVVAAVFTLRGIAFVPMMLIAPSWMRRFTDHTKVDAFITVTSLVCIALGAGYASGLRAT
jgi:putative oxidoreductase